MGYRPNPLVSMFQSQARSSRPLHLQASLGWLNDYPNESCWKDFPWLRGYWEGARDRCAQSGYRLEQINFQSNGRGFDEEVERLANRLRREGIYGLVLPLVLNAKLLEVRWESCVTSIIGSAHREKPQGPENLPTRFYPLDLPSADRDLYYNMRLTFQNLLHLGYSRIGFVYSEYLNEEGQGRAHAGYLLEQNEQPGASRLPVLFLERFKEGRPLEFDEWFHRHMPDAIICVNPVIREWILSMGLTVPGDVGLANLNIVDDVSDWSGILESHKAVGASAVDLILSSLARNELGQVPEPRKVLVPGQWHAGSTLRANLLA
ncbi:MAG: hypothetical protein Fur0032_14270 [Terrimicrobiaceae bacterium]